ACFGFGWQVDLLRPEVRCERVSVGIASRGAGSGAGVLHAAFALVAEVLLDAGIGGDFGQDRIGVGEQLLVRFLLDVGGINRAFVLGRPLFGLAATADVVVLLVRSLRFGIRHDVF